MKGKPLINQANLQKISKTQPFLIRGKPNPNRSQRQKNVQKTTQQDVHNTQLDQCCQILQSYLLQLKPLTYEHADRLHKLLLLYKNRSTMMQSLVVQDQLEESSSLMIRHSESKYFNKMKNDFQDQRDEHHTLNEKVILEAPRLRNTKLKLGKENNSKSTINFEVKLQKMQSKLAQQEQCLKEQIDKISVLNEELDQLKKKNLRTESENLQINIKHIETQSQLEIALQKRKQAESQLTSKSVQMSEKIQELQQTIKTLNQQLGDREAEIVALFRKQL